MLPCLTFVLWIGVCVFFASILYFSVVVEVIEEDMKDFIVNFSMSIVNSFSSIVPGCVSL